MYKMQQEQGRSPSVCAWAERKVGKEDALGRLHREDDVVQLL